MKLHAICPAAYPLLCACRLLHRAEHAHHDFFDVWSSRVREFKEFGVGHMMYFYFLYWMSVLFVALSLITGIPNMALSSMGRLAKALLGHPEDMGTS